MNSTAIAFATTEARLERRHPCLHECEARTNHHRVEPFSVDAAATAALQARMPALQSLGDLFTFDAEFN